MLVSSQYKNMFAIAWIMLCIIAKTIYIQICQFCNSTVIRIDKHTYAVNYVVNGIMYTMVVKPNRGPRSVIEAVDENDEDLTHEIITYLGPCENFHGTKLSPKFFNKKVITLSLSSGDEVVFENDQTLSI